MAASRETAERVKLLFEFSPGGYLLSAVVGGATTVVLWGEVRREFLLAWIASVLLVCGGRYLLYLAYQRRPPPVERAVEWERHFTVGSTLMGVAWAALPLFLFPERNTEVQLALTFIVAAMAMGGVGILAPSPLALSLFIAPMALAMVARLLMQGGSVFVGIGVVAIFYVALLAWIGTEFHKALTETIRARFEKEALIEKLRHSQDMLGDAIESLPEALAIYDAGDRLMLCNRRYAQAQTAFDDPAQLVGKSFADLVRLSVAKGEEIEPEFRGDVEAWIAERIRRRQEEAGSAPRMYRIADGRWMLTSISRTRAGGLVAVRTDITRQREIEQSLQAALIEEQRIMDTARVGIVFLVDRKVAKCNRQFAAMFAYAPEELLGHSSAIWFPNVENWQRIGQEAYSTVERGEPYEFEQEFVKKNGERLWCHVAGRILDPHDFARGSIWVYSDVTERKKREEEVRDLAHHDSLTGLPNRRLLDDRMTQTLAAARRSREHAALMLLDLDRFKPINDSHGHEVGDAVLKEVAARLKGCVRESDTVARVGGDEFVVMVPMRSAQDAVRVAEKILVAIAEPIPVGGNEVRVGVSIGISVFPEDASDKEELLKYADRAMYHVKAAGRNSYAFYAREPSKAQA